MTSYFLKSGLGYSVSVIITSISNAIFWLIAVKFIDPNEIGLASAVFSIPVLFASILVLSVDYPILKYISKEKSYFGSIFVFGIIINLILIPILWITFQKITSDFLLFAFAIIILFCIPIRGISASSLIGSFSIRSVVIIDIISVLLKIILLVLVLNFQLGSIGIIIALSGQFFISALIILIIVFKKFGLHVKIKSLKITLVEGISNFPIKSSAVLQYFGAISILALFVIPQEDIAGFTVTYGFIVFVSAIPTGLALLAIPSSIEQKKDMSSVSTTWSMVLAIPIITVMVVSPDLILRIYSDSYTKYGELLIILAISVVPFILKTNIITILNNQGFLKRLVLLGIIESAVFLASIVILIPSVGVIAGGWAVLIASIGATILSLYWANNAIRKIFFISILVLIAGIGSGLLVHQITDNKFVVTLVAFGISIGSLFLFRLIKFSEVLFIINQIKNRKA